MTTPPALPNDRVIGLILARGGSKGIVRKNLRALAGVPLVARAVETLVQVAAIDRVVVSTDNEEIASVALAYGAEIPFLRPASLAQDDTPALDCVRHALEALRSEGERAATVVLLQATSPGCTPRHVGEALEQFRRSSSTSLRSVTAVTEHPQWMGTLVQDRFDYLHPQHERATRRQDLPPLYRLNGAITILGSAQLLAGAGEDEKPSAYVMDAEASIDIDSEADWQLADRSFGWGGGVKV